MKKAKLGLYPKGSFDNDELPWRWFGTLPIRGSTSASAAYGIYHEWFDELEKWEGRTNSIDYVRIDERRPFKRKFCFHVLMGGDRIGNKGRAILSWVNLGGGEARLYSYRPNSFIPYVVSQVHADSDIEIIGHVCGSPIIDF